MKGKKGFQKGHPPYGWAIPGHITTKATRERISNVMRGRSPWNKGRAGVCKSPFKGKKRPEYELSGNPKWKGGKPHCKSCGNLTRDYVSKKCRSCYLRDCRGILEDTEKVRRSARYRQWRTVIFQRDKYTCQDCGIKGGYLEVHHKKHFCQIVFENKIRTIREANLCKELWDINNGVTLCRKCHEKTKKYVRKISIE